MTTPDFDAGPPIRALVGAAVRFVLIGGLAARVHGSPSMTTDIDICYARDLDNLEGLAEVLRGLNATLRGAPAGVPFQLDAQTLERGDHFTFDTSAGPVDILGTPAGCRGFVELAPNAVERKLYGVPVLVAHIDDLIRMKTAAGRPKDRVEVEILGALREVLEERGEL